MVNDGAGSMRFRYVCLASYTLGLFRFRTFIKESKR